MSRTLASAAQALLGQTSPVEEVFRWDGLPPAWVVVLVVIPLVVLLVTWVYRRESPSGNPAWRWVLAVPRVLVILAVLAMIARPYFRRTSYEIRRSTILVLVDDSLSMGDIVDRYSDRDIPSRLAEVFGSSPETVESTSRYDLVRRLMSQEDLSFLERLREKGRVAVATFAQSAAEVVTLPARDETGGDEVPTPTEVLPPYSTIRGDPRVQETRIAESLRQAVRNVIGTGFGESSERVSGVLLLSDGQENSGSGSAVEIARRLRERGTPVHTVGVGNPDEPRDLRLTNLDVDEIVLVDDLVSVDVSIIADGYEGERITLELTVDSDAVDTRYITLEGQGRRQIERLEFRPRKPGELTLTAEAERLGGEVFYDNNSISRTLRVLDEKIRVLYVESLPRWEYRFLKNALIRDATMEAQVFLVSADPDFIQESSPSVPPLREIPRTREDLFRNHVIILGDVGSDELGEEVQGLLKEFVLEGGGVIFIAGRHANPSSYAFTDVSPLLPVEVATADPTVAGKPRLFTRSFKARLTEVGKQHPVMRLVSDGDENLRLWEGEDGSFTERLPGFYRYAQVEGEKAAAVVLARHPEDLHPLRQTGRVIFAFMNYGKGRTFFSAVDDTWRWRAGVDNLYFGRFWGQVIRFVASGRLLGKTPRYSVTTDKAVYAIGDTVRIDARVYDASMKPSTEPSVTLFHLEQGRAGEPPDRLELSLNEVKGRGAYEGSMVASTRGRHDVWLGTPAERVAFRSFTVEIPALESRDPRLDRRLLQDIARAGGGEYHDLDRVLEAADKLEGISRSQEGLVESDDLWDEWWVLLLLTGLLSLEWILRKRVRLE